jgi:ATP-dependent DNA ligase
MEPMLLLRSSELPEGASWLIELKLDGFRAIAFKAAGKVQLCSRNDKDFNERYPEVVNRRGSASEGLDLLRAAADAGGVGWRSARGSIGAGPAGLHLDTR